MKIRKIFKYILLFLVITFVVLAVYSTNWALSTFAFVNFDEILFQLLSPIESAGGGVLGNYINTSLIPSLILSLVIFIFICIIYRYLNSLGKKYINIINTLFILVSLFLLYNCLDRLSFFEYLFLQISSSNFIEENYVDGRDINITLEDDKKNLIFIYAESLESTYFSNKYGGGSCNNYLSPLVELTKNNISFSNGNKFGGGEGLSGTSWTSSALVGSTSGLPMKMRVYSPKVKKNLINNVYTLGDVLKDNGYNQIFMIGSDGEFGYRNNYFKEHGYEIYDFNTAIEIGKIDKDYKVWWGVEDSKLFSFAKSEINRLVDEDKPFNLTLLTTGTHTLDGYIEDDCDGGFSSKYGNAIYCSSIQIDEFIDWILEQEFMNNTTVVLIGDHISMQPNFYPEGTERHTYNLFINSYVKEGNFNNRVFTTLDIYPTTLASLGFKIEGDRLGLGTNLFSDKKTLAEEYGVEEFNKELLKSSKFYNERFLVD